MRERIYAQQPRSTHNVQSFREGTLAAGNQQPGLSQLNSPTYSLEEGTANYVRPPATGEHNTLLLFHVNIAQYS